MELISLIELELIKVVDKKGNSIYADSYIIHIKEKIDANKKMLEFIKETKKKIKK